MGSDWKDKLGDGYTASIGWRDKLIRKSANKIREWLYVMQRNVSR